MICKILVPVRGDGKGENVLNHAAVLAHKFGSHVQVTHCRPRPEDMLPYGIPVPAFLKDQLREQASKLADAEEQGIKDKFTEISARLDLNIATAGSAKGASASWIEEPGKQVDVIKRHGRLADVIAVAKPDRDRNLGSNTLKAALFNTGRPVLMCPPTNDTVETLGENIALAWNGSTEAARAVALTLDLLEAADTVTILAGGREEPHGASAEDLQEYLKLRSIDATVVRFKIKSNAGKGLLEQAASAGSDVLIMGAYGDSHERETVFGGNTQTIVDKSKMPVILVH
ncbi:MAG: universal stress protein [Hyphomicrobiales bacterium]